MAIHAVVRTHPTMYSRTLCDGLLSPGVMLFDAGDGQTYLRRPDKRPACRDEIGAYDWNSGWCDACRVYDGSFFIVRLCREHDQYEKSKASS